MATVTSCETQEYLSSAQLFSFEINLNQAISKEIRLAEPVYINMPAPPPPPKHGAGFQPCMRLTIDYF